MLFSAGIVRATFSSAACQLRSSTIAEPFGAASIFACSSTQSDVMTRASPSPSRMHEKPGSATKTALGSVSGLVDAKP